MSTFKITNITDFLGKRDYKANSVLDIEYVDNMTKKIMSVKPKESVYLTINALPLSVHRLRVKNLITVSEVSDAEVATLQTRQTQKAKSSIPTKPKSTRKVMAEGEPVEFADKVESSKKTKTVKKETEK